MPETANLYTVAVAVCLFGAYASAFGVGWAILLLFGGERWAKWFWPDRRKGKRYLTIAAINAVLALMALAAVYIYDRAPRTLFVGCVLLAVASCVLTYSLVAAPDRSASERATWQWQFVCARTLFLFVIAAVPAIVCFNIADAFEARLLVERGQLRLATDLDKREARIRRQAAELCSENREATDCSKLREAFIDLRRGGNRNTGWDIHSLPFFETRLGGPASQPARGSGAGWVESFLRFAHPPINGVSTELAAGRLGRGIAKRRASVDTIRDGERNIATHNNAHPAKIRS